MYCCKIIKGRREREKQKYKWDSGRYAEFNSNIYTAVINGTLRNVNKIA